VILCDVDNFPCLRIVDAVVVFEIFHNGYFR
jgi:hypothetical protein